MGHRLTGDFSYARFNRFPVMPWLARHGESVAVPRFEWLAKDGEQTHFAMLGELPTLELPAWLCRDEADSDWLRVPTWVEPAWYLRDALPALKAQARGLRRGRLVVTATFAFRLHARELPGVVDELNVVFKNRAPLLTRETLASPSPEQRALLENNEERHFLWRCASYLADTGAASVFIDDDETLGDAHRVRFFQLTSSRVSARESLEETLGALKTSGQAFKHLHIGTLFANGLREASPVASALFVESARLQLERGESAQSRADLAWARHLSTPG